jgi:glycosyltransferase involved in cell wall biosynthesis
MQSAPFRIMVFTGHFHPHPKSGGLEKYVEELYSRLAATRKYEIYIATFGDEGERAGRYRGLHVHRLAESISVAGVFNLPTYASWRHFVARTLPEIHPDLIVTQTRFFPSSLLGARLAKKLRIPHLHTEHGSDFVRHSSPIISGGAKIWDMLPGRYVLRSAQQITGVSQGVQTFVKHLAKRDAIIAYNGVDTAFWDPALACPLPREWQEWLGTRTAFLYVGRLMRVKGYEVLLDVMRALPKEDRAKSAVIIVGSGPEEIRLEALIKEHHLEDCVYAVGRQKPEVIRDLLHRCTYVNPSFSAEGLQTTLLEAGAMNSWIITTDVSGAREVVSEDGIGEVVAQQDTKSFSQAMQQVVRERPKSYARTSIERRFGWARLVKQFEEIIAPYGTS